MLGHHLAHLAHAGHTLHAWDLAHHAEVLTQPAHHLLHEHELLDHRRDLRFFCSRASGDPCCPTWLTHQRVRIGALGSGHGLDDGADPYEFAVVEVDALGQSAGQDAAEGQLVDEIL